MTEIPIVSLQKVSTIAETSVENWVQTAAEIGKALSSTGFVFLSHHGIPQASIDAVFQESVSFFDCPLDLKKKYPRDMKYTFHGYTPVGSEAFFKNTPAELRETFDYAVAESEINRPFPDNYVPKFGNSIKTLGVECGSLSKKVLKLLAISLNLDDKDYFNDHHQVLNNSKVENYTQLRTLFYPSVNGMVPPGTVRCGEHTDFGTFTFLFQDSFGGLEVEASDGRWINVTPQPGCILMNTADLLELWSAGCFKSTLHRVTVPVDEVRRKAPRQSVAYFLKPDNASIVYPLPLNGILENVMDMPNFLNAGEHFRRRTDFTKQAAIAIA